jgi:plasmid maintenance system antidote protein VapI
MAVRLSRLFGTAPEFWMNLQRNVDLWEAAQHLAADIGRIRPLQAA